MNFPPYSGFKLRPGTQEPGPVVSGAGGLKAAPLKGTGELQKLP